jgi:hypothetical protein
MVFQAFLNYLSNLIQAHWVVSMKTAQEFRAGNVIMVGKDPMVILKAEFNKSGRNSAVVKM